MIDLLTDPRVAATLVGIVDRRVDQLVARLMQRSRYGMVTAIDTGSASATVQLVGDTTAAPGFAFARWMVPAVGDAVRVVITPGGDRYIDEVLPAAGLPLSNPGIHYMGTTFPDAIEPPTDWPAGFSWATTSTGTAQGYPAGFGTIVTVHLPGSNDRGFQYMYAADLDDDTGGVWYRTAHSSIVGTNAPWGAWHRLLTFSERAVSLLSGSIGGNAGPTTLSNAALPPGTHAAELSLITSTTVPNITSELRVLHGTTGHVAGRCMVPGVASYEMSNNATVELDANGDFQYQIIRAAGTISYSIQLRGVWR